MYNDKISFYDKLIQGYKLLLITVSFILICVGVHQVFVVGHKIDLNVQTTQQIIINNQKSTLEARKTNMQTLAHIRGYLKCVFLARFDSPEAVSPTATRQQVSDAADKCAKVQ